VWHTSTLDDCQGMEKEKKKKAWLLQPRRDMWVFCWCQECNADTGQPPNSAPAEKDTYIVVVHIEFRVVEG